MIENYAGRNITKILDDFFGKGNYDKRVRPNYGGAPVEVGVTMHIIGISSVSEVQMDFTSDFYFRQKWKDNRLSFEPTSGVTELVVGSEVAKNIWVPDTFFANEKLATFHDATTPNTFLRIDHTGHVYRSIRLTVTASCPMDLQYFPMDRQLCTLEIESYGYSMADIIYVWGNGPGSVGKAPGLELPQFKVVGHKQSTKIENLSTGNYSRLVCEIHFVRSMGYYLIQIYIPASLIVIISWVSFYLHRNATPARVALGVTTVLTMTTLMSSTNAALPKISYIKSIDVFLGTCFVMVFASLLEYAAVGYLGKRIAMRKTRTQQLAKLAQEHRNRCAAAAAAAAAAESGAVVFSGIGQTVVPACQQQHHQPQPDQSPSLGGCIGGHTGPVLCPASMDSTLPRPLSVKTMPLHHTIDRNERMERYQGMGTPRIVHHPSIQACPPTCAQDVRLKMSDAKSYAKTYTTVENPLNNGGSSAQLTSSAAAVASAGQQQLLQPPPTPTPGAGGGGQEPDTPSTPASAPFGCKNPNKLFGVSPSDIDKYSRVVFPVCFICFNFMYWIIYLHISHNVEPDLMSH
ncbi:gamma-aminobutyric acid receptor subunit beta-like [Oppia nitens]|uniref:gamma-aminobutyric acid receptor subunit beta-like n=1 Tax=Oppia nitens TaxID=1686743 RepID=UPI0023D9F12C|nr:gamma-aminobutyric acid receptor subunit beta-like [Oppia nitens]